jgi:uncharacterized protein YciI
VTARPELVSYSLVLLRRGPKADELPDQELDRLQEAHPAHLQETRERGAMVAAGPFREQEDESLRGLCLYVVGLKETRALVRSLGAGRPDGGRRDEVVDAEGASSVPPFSPVAVAALCPPRRNGVT